MTFKGETNLLSPLRIPLYPYFFAWFTVLQFWSLSPLSASFLVVLLTLLFVSVLCALLSLLLSFVVRNAEKRAMICLVVLIPFFTYGSLSVRLDATRYSHFLFQYHIPFIISLGLVSSITFLIVRAKAVPDLITKFLSIFFSILLVSSLFVDARAYTVISRAQQSLTIPTLNVGDSRPDIYYLLFDEYTGPKALQKLYGYDDSGFLQDLRDRKMFVATDSTSNYYGSLHSLVSTFNLKPLDPLTTKVSKQSSDQGVLEDLADNNRLVLALKNVGYQYYNLGSWWEPTSTNHSADENYVSQDLYLGLPPFTYHFFSGTTMAAPLLGRFFSHTSRETVDYQENQTIELAKKGGDPKFVFTHFILPHLPDIYTADCSPLPESVSEKSDANVSAYLDQVTCTNKIIVSLVDSILKNSKNPPIIVVQSDEGQEMSYAPPTSTQSALPAFAEKYSILNAFYFPDQNYQKLYPSITSVNTFRVVLDQYFGANLTMKPDQNFILDTYFAINNSLDVTDQVHAALQMK